MTLPARLAQQTGAALLLAWGERLPAAAATACTLRPGRRAGADAAKPRAQVNAQMERWCASARSSTCGAMRATSSRARSWHDQPLGILFMQRSRRCRCPGSRGSAGVRLVLYVVVLPRRTWWTCEPALCFPHWSRPRERVARGVFRTWRSRGSIALAVARRPRVCGAAC
jgi:hypothetical protein